MVRPVFLSLMTSSILCLATTLHAQAAKPAGKDAGNAHAGETLFMQKCFQCHSVAEGEVRFGPSLYHEVKKPKPKKTEAEVRLIIKNGKNKMPAWGAILTAQDTDNLLAYIRSL